MIALEGYLPVRLQTFARYVLCGCTLSLNSAIFRVRFGLAGLWYLFAQVVTAALILSITFTVDRRYTFARE